MPAAYLVVMKRLLREWEQFWTASSLSCLIEQRRLGTERKFSQQAWQVTSHLRSPRTTKNKADFSTLYNSLQDFTGKEGGVKVSLTSDKWKTYENVCVELFESLKRVTKTVNNY